MSSITGEFCRAAAALLARLTLLRRVTSVPPHGGQGGKRSGQGWSRGSKVRAGVGGVPLPDQNCIMEASPPSQNSRGAEYTHLEKQQRTLKGPCKARHKCAAAHRTAGSLQLRGEQHERRECSGPATTRQVEQRGGEEAEATGSSSLSFGFHLSRESWVCNCRELCSPASMETLAGTCTFTSRREVGLLSKGGDT